MRCKRHTLDLVTAVVCIVSGGLVTPALQQSLGGAFESRQRVQRIAEIAGYGRLAKVTSRHSRAARFERKRAGNGRLAEQHWETGTLAREPRNSGTERRQQARRRGLVWLAPAENEP